MKLSNLIILLLLIMTSCKSSKEEANTSHSSTNAFFSGDRPGLDGYTPARFLNEPNYSFEGKGISGETFRVRLRETRRRCNQELEQMTKALKNSELVSEIVKGVCHLMETDSEDESGTERMRIVPPAFKLINANEVLRKFSNLKRK